MDTPGVRKTQASADDGQWKLPSKVEQPGNLDARPVFDLPQALKNVDGIQDLLVELIGLFFEECPKLVERVRTSVQNGDAAGLILAAHTLKGVASNLGAFELATEARQLEEIGKQNRLEDAQLVRLRLEHAVGQLLPLLHDYHDRMSASGMS